MTSASCFSADIQLGVPFPGTSSPSSAAVGNTGSDLVVLKDFVRTVSSLLRHNKFDQLDVMADSERSGKERFPGGSWKLYSLYQVLEAPSRADGSMPTDADYEGQIDRLQNWIARNPSSVTARIALAGTYHDYAWKARGNDLADKVTDEGWRLFGERDALAEAALRDASKLSPVCPQWFYEMMQIAKDEGWDGARTRALMERAFLLEPDYYYVYQAYAENLLPKWNGKEGDSERFIEEISNRIGGVRGDMAYFEIARKVGCGICGSSKHLKPLDWPRMKRGFAATEERYGVSTYKLNQMADGAIRLSDVPFAATLFERIGENWDPTTWRSKSDFDQYKEFAIASRQVELAPIAYAGPMPEEVRRIESAAVANSDPAENAQYSLHVYVQFARKQKSAVAECLRAAGENFGGSFNLYLQIGQAGNVMDAKAWPRTKVGECVVALIQATTLTVPPRSPYYVMLNIRLPLHPFGTEAAQQSPH